MPTRTDLDVVAHGSEVFFDAARWWTEAFGTALVDSDVNTLEGWRVLGALRHGDGSTMSEMSAAMAIPPPTLTRIVDKLVDGGFVLRRVDAADRRRVLIYLSARGKTKVRKLSKSEALVRQKLVDHLGADATAQFLSTLARIGELTV
ncbi:MarR family winged helix-turn-helix transcriptional regulator [Mycolicibacterium sp. 050158]|nr:MarR family winged helix-turn-helix transcriptional regulator [Mycolicibacterium sp. 050158]MDX1892170.1 MarR family winged helix-turn-helix transcriptional regulator [Mycolicibacterium sp. 050158]